MDWARAIEINRIALTRIVAELFAMLGLVAAESLERLPHAVYVAAERLLRPTESALRRLIVIAARGLVVKPSPKRLMPKGVEFLRKASGRMSFQLFDTRKSFNFIESEKPLFVRVKTHTSNPFNPFDRMYGSHAAEPSEGTNAVQLCRRLAAVKQALETLPRQAMRMARWKARRKLMEKPKFTSPLRPGPPPGQRANPSSKIDFVLQECHALAQDALREDSS